MLRLLALTAAVNIVAGCGEMADRPPLDSIPAASAEEVDGFTPFARPAVDRWISHEISTTFEESKAAAKTAETRPSF